jgi:micrococcal nuclease
VDGDTIIVGDTEDRDKQFRIRFIAADAPEVARGNRRAEPFAQEASDFTKRMIEMASNRVRLAYDGEELDRWSRTRALVYLTMPNGSEVLLNEELIRQGYAHARLQFSYSQGKKLKFAMAEIEARRHKRGMWSQPIFPDW